MKTDQPFKIKSAQMKRIRDWIKANLRPAKHINMKTPTCTIQGMYEFDADECLPIQAYIIAMLLEGYECKQSIKSRKFHFNVCRDSIVEVVVRQFPYLFK